MARPKKVTEEVKESVEITEQLPPEPIAETLPQEPQREEVIQDPTPHEPSHLPQYRVERQVETGAIPGVKLPSVIGGVCEYCGPALYDHSSPQKPVELWTVDPETQVGRCEHYKGVKIRCSYCPVNADWKDNILHRKHQIFVSPWNPKELIVVCSDMRCREKHLKRAMGGR